MKRLFFFLLLLPLISLHAAPVRDRHVEAELIAQNTSVQPGEPFWVGVKLTMDERWHTYWQNPGDSGLGTTIDWALPEGFSAGSIAWPHPHRIPIPPLVNYGYEDEVVLLTQLTPPANLSGADVTLGAKVNWLMCDEQCIPGKATIELVLPIKDSAPESDANNTDAFKNAFDTLPVASDGWATSARQQGNIIELEVTPPEDWTTGQTGVYFFANSEGVIEPSAPQTVEWNGRTLRLKMARAEVAPKAITTLSGVLYDETGWQPAGRTPAVEIDARFAETAPAVSPAAPRANARTFPVALLFAFLGGMLLNLMPCVFPVLSLKVVHLVEQSRETQTSAIKHALVFSVGVLISMWALAAVLLALRSSGSMLGWAFQLSNPAFVLALTFLFLLIALNMFGVFEVGIGLSRAGGAAQDQKGVAGSFFSGLLTTIAGAPCAGPFLGSVIGYALSQPTNIALLAFTAMGLGTAAPYAILSTNPRLLKALPKSGKWMDTMKQLMAFPMLATAGWFASIYSKLHGGNDATFRIMIAFVLVGAAAWVFGKWTALHRSNGVRWIARIAAIALFSLAMRFALSKSDLAVEQWSQAKVIALRAAGKPIFVDFTAEWCAICQVNKRVALQNADVVAMLKQKGVTVLVADWTDQSDEVSAGLAEFGRAAVPFYVFYGRGPDAEPKILPEVLTPGLILDTLSELP